MPTNYRPLFCSVVLWVDYYPRSSAPASALPFSPFFSHSSKSYLALLPCLAHATMRVIFLLSPCPLDRPHTQSQAVLLVLWNQWNVLKDTCFSWVIATLVGHATVGEMMAAAGRRACRPVADRTDIDASLAITISVTPAMRPRGKVQTPARDC